MATEHSSAASFVFGLEGWSPHSYFTVEYGTNTRFSTCSADPDTDTSEPKRSQSSIPLPAFALIFASSWLISMANDLAVEPLAEMVGDLDVKMALKGTDPTSPDHDRLVSVPENTATFMLSCAAFLLVAAVVDSAVRVIATVAMCSGEQEQHTTLGALLGKARPQLKGPVLTLAFVYALEIVYAALLSDMAALAFASVFLTSHAGVAGAGVLLLLRTLLLLAASVSLAYLASLCAFAVAVAGPGCHGAGAVRRAWRLLMGRRRGRPAGVPFTFMIGALVAASSHARALARTRGGLLGDHLAPWLLLWLLSIAAMAAVLLLATGGAITAFYHECKESAEVAATEFVRLATEDLIDASSAPCHAAPNAC